MSEVLHEVGLDTGHVLLMLQELPRLRVGLGSVVELITSTTG